MPRFARLVMFCVLGLTIVVSRGWPEGTSPSLQEQIQTYETLGAQITETQPRVTKARGGERRRLERELQALKAAQDRAFDAIERAVGPLPPAIRHEPTILLEEMLKARHQRDEAVLERDVDRRLPRN